MSIQPEPDSRLLRLLPWSDDGKTTYLVTDGTETWMSRLADRVEEQQIETATLALRLTKPMVADGAKNTAPELRWAVRRLIESLTDLLTIAESRGQRIPDYRDGDSPTGDGH
ncbi:hypothetical protein [Streptomyces griseoflavus]|uniref:hypothetical protein n=1 Tax=Streptomyces griseoflavus TaxID=35619 RepID=UPI0001B4DBFF|nr:hypothetical protein [Streptomyces griseoflavus]